MSQNSNIPLENLKEDDSGSQGKNYKWIALSNVIISSLMGMINMSIVLISLPAIFNGIHINPLNSFQYLLWILMGYGLVTATLLLSFGRLSDMYGRVRMFRLGFLIFTLGSVLLYLTPSTGDAGALEIIGFRVIQAVGSALFMANSAAILTDAFPPNERGKALGINMVALMSGQFIGLILGGVLAFFDWRYVFLVSVPFGLLGTIWSYYKLKETSIKAPKTRIDIWGNLTFVVSITLLLIGVTYGLMPYGNDPMGWNNPWVIASMVTGVILLAAFLFIESRVESPMFQAGSLQNKNVQLRKCSGFIICFKQGWNDVHAHTSPAGYLAAFTWLQLPIHAFLGGGLHVTPYRWYNNHGPSFWGAFRSVRTALDSYHGYGNQLHSLPDTGSAPLQFQLLGVWFDPIYDGCRRWNVWFTKQCLHNEFGPFPGERCGIRNDVHHNEHLLYSQYGHILHHSHCRNHPKVPRGHDRFTGQYRCC